MTVPTPLDNSTPQGVSHGPVVLPAADSLSVQLAGNSASGVDKNLVNNRLGAYSGLFHALRAKHPPTAAHCLRVALVCSRWAGYRKLDDTQRGVLEVAALLHDVGKIGIPDAILQKPSRLSTDEQLYMEMHVEIATEMLSGSCAQEQILEVIKQAHNANEQALEQRSTIAKMLATVDAFDSMTTEQVFRRPLSYESAFNEMFRNVGTQFEQSLVIEFAELVGSARPELDHAVAAHWLTKLFPEEVPGFSSGGGSISCGAHQSIVDSVFQPRLLDAMSDAAIYLDANRQVLLWNRAAEQLTGRVSAAMVHHQWSAAGMGLVEEDGTPLHDSNCPFALMRKTNTKTTQRMQLAPVSGKPLAVTVSVLPVFRGKGAFCGAIILVHDTSIEASLEQRVESLNEIANRDPLTKVANRVALDRKMPEIIQEHLDTGESASVIICDIDFFKKINDTFGHQAGDDALVTFAGVLSETARSSDLVARFGGEEFVVVCPRCDIASATARAEEIRLAVARTPVPSLDGRTMTASFGVTELQKGDTQTLLLERADRALMDAKSAGRNRVMQVGVGQHAIEPDVVSGTENGREDAFGMEPIEQGGWFSWFQKGQEVELCNVELLASVPPPLAVQKLAGFVNDCGATIVEATEQVIRIRVDMNNSRLGRRVGERPAVLLAEIGITPVDVRLAKSSSYQSRTKLSVSIRTSRARDRRAEALRSQASRLLASLRAYLVTELIDEELSKIIIEPR